MTKITYHNLMLLTMLAAINLAFGSESKTPDHDHHDNHQKQHTSEAYYTCSMHPQIKESRSGRCPICSMALARIEIATDRAGELEQETNIAGGNPITSDVIAKVKLRKAQLKHFFPEYFRATRMQMTKEIRLLGSVLQAEEKKSYIPARVEGRVEEVMVASAGKLIKHGDKVLKLYSPKLIASGEEYIISRKSYVKSRRADFRYLMQEAKQRLELWGIRKPQYESWYRSGKVPNRITIYSQSSGIVSKRVAAVGKYFKRGQNFFELYDLSEVWVEMDVYEHDAGVVDLDQTVKMRFAALPGEEIEANIDFINPVLNTESRTLKVRATIANPTGVLKPGMIADSTVYVDLGSDAVVIPRTAIIDTGKRKVVWVKKTDRIFEASVIQTGVESEGYVAIKNGLEEGDAVVIEGNFLLDAQAQLFGGYTTPLSTNSSSDPRLNDDDDHHHHHHRP